MPLYKQFNINATSQILIWEITETFEDLFDEVFMKDISLIRVNNMKSLSHQKGFLSIRKYFANEKKKKDEFYPASRR